MLVRGFVEKQFLIYLKVSSRPNWVTLYPITKALLGKNVKDLYSHTPTNAEMQTQVRLNSAKKNEAKVYAEQYGHKAPT